MENDFVPEGPFDFSTSTQMGSNAAKIQSALDSLKKQIKESPPGTDFTAKMDEVKKQIDQLQEIGAPMSQTMDLESQLLNFKNLIKAQAAPIEDAPQPVVNEGVGKLISNALESQEQLTDAQLDRTEKASKELMASGKPLKEILHLSDDAIEMVYTHAYFLYQSAKYQQASHVFWILNALAPDDVRFYLGIAACHHQQKKYIEAATVYILASVIDLDDPMPAYYLSDCQIEMGLFDLAKESLQQVIDRGMQKKEHHVLVDRAKLTLDKLKAEHPAPAK